LCIEFLFASTSNNRLEVTTARTPILPLLNSFNVRVSVSFTERHLNGVEEVMFSPEMSIREISVSPDSPDVCWVWFLVAIELTNRVLWRIALRKFCSFGVDND